MLEYCIQDHTGASAVILPEKGATVISYCVDGQEFFYRDDANLASSERPRCGIPFLFPVFGRTPEGSPYPMQIHGFGHTSSWTVVESSESSLMLELLSNDDTRKGYPFQFRVQLTFSLENGRLKIHQKYENKDNKRMPYAFGFHPYFAVENVKETAVALSADYEMDMATGKPAPCTKDRVTLAFAEGAEETGAFFLNARNGATIQVKNGKKIRMNFDENFPRLVFWAVRGKKFLCVEPINSSPNGLASGDCLYLDPGESHEAEISFEIL